MLIRAPSSCCTQGRKWRLNFHYNGINNPTFVSAFLEMLNVKDFRGGRWRRKTFQLALLHNDELKKTIVRDSQVSALVLRATKTLQATGCLLFMRSSAINCAV
jgi:hypothetical protein